MRWRSRPICSACRRCARQRPPTRWPFRSTSAGRWCSGRRCSIRTSASSPIPSKSPEWNRGAYLAEALAHCGECHTPRNLAFALDNRKKFAGALTAGWRAFNITSDKAPGVGAWSDDDLVAYLSTGHAAGHGTASGPMGEAVDHSFSQLAPEDIRAMVAYLRSVPAIASPDLPATLAPPAPASHKDGVGTPTRAARWSSRAPASVATAGPARARSRRSPR